MAITGQFGKIITGSGSVASAISGIASSYITLRLNRIYNAFISKESFEGREVTAAVAIELLNRMMAITSKGGKSQMDIEETLRSVRKANRTRTLNEVDTELKEQGAIGDYAKKVRILEEMLLDPTLNPDETSDLRDELNDAIDDLLTNTQNQFASGGKVTLNGRTVDFANGANEAQLLSLFDDQISKNPETAEKLNKQRVTAEASIFVAKANAAWLSKSRTSDSEKSDGYSQQLKFLQQAYDLLNNSKYGLATEAQRVLTDIRNIQENQSIAKKNISGTVASTTMTNGYNNIFGDLDLLDEQMKKDPIVASMFQGKETFATLLQADQNFALSIMDQYIANNGSSISRPDGTKISLTVDNISDMMRDSRVAAAALYKWSKTASGLSESQKETIKSYDTYATGLGKSAPMLTTEDKYDDAVDDLSKSMDSAGADLGARAAALRAFSRQLRLLGGTAGLPASVQKSLFAEADLYLTGKRPADGVVLYGDYSGNIVGANNASGIYNMDEILGGIISPGASGERVSIYSAINGLYTQESEWIAGGGRIITDINGNDVADTGTQDTSAWEKGQSIRIKALGTITIGDDGASVTSLIDQDLQRIRIVSPGGQASPENLDDYTMGFVARVKQSDGTFRYIVTKRNSASGRETLVVGTEAETFVKQFLRGGNWDAMKTTIGGNVVLEIPAGSLESFNTFGDSLDAAGLANGSVWTAISTDSRSGYGWASQYQASVDASILKAVKADKLVVRGGKVYLPKGKKIGGSQGEAFVDLDITSLLSETTLSDIVRLYEKVDKGVGEGATEGGSVKPKAPVGKDRWTGTQWAGQDGSTVISTTASGKPLTLDQAFSSGTGYMYDNTLKPSAKSVPAMPAAGRSVSPASKAKLDAEMSKYDRAKASTVRGAGMSNVVSGKATAAIQADSGAQMLGTFMRNMPTGTGVTGATPATGSKPVYKQPERRRNV